MLFWDLLFRPTLGDNLFVEKKGGKLLLPIVHFVKRKLPHFSPRIKNQNWLLFALFTLTQM